MGLLNFVKEAGEKIWDAVSGDSKEDRAEKLKKHIDGLNLPGAEKVNIDVAEDGTATAVSYTHLATPVDVRAAGVR